MKCAFCHKDSDREICPVCLDTKAKDYMKRLDHAPQGDINNFRNSTRSNYAAALSRTLEKE